MFFGNSSCQKDNEYNHANKTKSTIVDTKENGNRSAYNPSSPPINPGYIDAYSNVILTFSSNTHYSERFSFESRDYILDTTNNSRLYLFESLYKEYNFLCVRISNDYQISESYIIDFADGMDFDLYIEYNIPVPFDVYTVDDVYAFSAEIDLLNNIYYIVNYNREMVQPPTDNYGSVFCNIAVYTASLPWTVGLSMIAGPWGYGLSILIGLGASVASVYICN